MQYAFAGQTKLSHFDSRSIYVTGGPLRKARGGGRNEMAAAFGAGRWRLDAARSNVQDTDYASETATLTKGQILQQAATAMLAQANQMPNVILSLLK